LQILAEPTLQDIFGVGATQTATTITILKADLPMTAAAVNRGEQILAATIIKASDKLTTANFASNPDQSISIEPGYNQTVYRSINNNQIENLRIPLTINFSKLQQTAGVTPDDY
jgi:hypothetical protein